MVPCLGLARLPHVSPALTRLPVDPSPRIQTLRLTPGAQDPAPRLAASGPPQRALTNSKCSADKGSQVLRWQPLRRASEWAGRRPRLPARTALHPAAAEPGGAAPLCWVLLNNAAPAHPPWRPSILCAPSPPAPCRPHATGPLRSSQADPKSYCRLVTSHRKHISGVPLAGDASLLPFTPLLNHTPTPTPVAHLFLSSPPASAARPLLAGRQ